MTPIAVVRVYIADGITTPIALSVRGAGAENLSALLAEPILADSATALTVAGAFHAIRGATASVTQHLPRRTSGALAINAVAAAALRAPRAVLPAALTANRVGSSLTDA